MFITSLSPKHFHPQIQEQSIQTWLDSGLGDVISMNSVYDPEINVQGVQFERTYRSMQGVFSKPYVQINAMIDYFLEKTDLNKLILINSDIQIFDQERFKEAYNQCNTEVSIMMHRFDYDQNPAQSTLYDTGVDCFILHRETAKKIPQTIYSMGQTFWDYWMPTELFRLGQKVLSYSAKPTIIHQSHPAQYSDAYWEKMAAYTMWHFDLGKQYKKYLGMANGLKKEFLTKSECV